MTSVFFVAMDKGIHISLKAEEVLRLWGFSVTNTLLMSWIVMAVLIIGAILIGRNLKKIPSHTQTFVETVFSFFLDYLEEVLESRVLAKRFFPLIATFFLFILVGNWFGLLPGIGSLYVNEPIVVGAESSTAGAHAFTENALGEAHHISLVYPVSVDLNFTLALAIIAILVIEIAGILYIGTLRYAGRFFNFRSLVGFFVGIIELLSEMARVVSFSFRLFGNMFAGKTLIVVAMFFVPMILPVPLMIYEVFVGLIQASIFSLLTLFYIKLAISEVH